MDASVIFSDAARMGISKSPGPSSATTMAAFGLFDVTGRLQSTGEHFRVITLSNSGITPYGTTSPWWDGKKNRIAEYTNDVAGIPVPTPRNLPDGHEALLFTSGSEVMVSPLDSIGDGVSAYPVARLLTFAGNAIAAETVVIGAMTWTWAASGNGNTTVTVGATAALSAAALLAAINTQWANVLRATAFSTTQILVEVISVAYMTTPLATTETMTAASWDAGSMPSANSATLAMTAGNHAMWRFKKNPISGDLTHSVELFFLENNGLLPPSLGGVSFFDGPFSSSNGTLLDDPRGGVGSQIIDDTNYPGYVFLKYKTLAIHGVNRWRALLTLGEMPPAS